MRSIFGKKIFVSLLGLFACCALALTLYMHKFFELTSLGSEPAGGKLASNMCAPQAQDDQVFFVTCGGLY